MNRNPSRPERRRPARADGENAARRSGLRAVCLLLALALLASVCCAGAVFAEQTTQGGLGDAAGPAAESAPGADGAAGFAADADGADGTGNPSGAAAGTGSQDDAGRPAPDGGPDAGGALDSTPGPQNTPDAGDPADPAPAPEPSAEPAPQPTTAPAPAVTPAPGDAPGAEPDETPAPEGGPDTDETPGLCPHHPAHTDECGGLEDPAACRFLCNACVISWQWQDEEGFLVWSEEAGLWGLGLPGAGADAPLTHEQLAAFLPAGILAKTPAGEREVPLAWALDALPDSLDDGEYTLTAALAGDGDFVLAETAPALTIVLAVGGGETFDRFPKYLNQWSFSYLNDSKPLVGADNSVIIGIKDLSHKSRNEIIELLKQELPSQLRGWGGPMVWGGYDFSHLASVDADQTQPKYETVAKSDQYPDGLRSFTGNAVWGRVNIIWPDRWTDRNGVSYANFPASFSNGMTFSLVASVLEKAVDSNTYQVYVNSNNPDDFANDPGDLNRDTQTNPAILTLKVTLYDLDPSDHIVRAANPNVKVNLFDYWVETQHPTDARSDILTGKNDRHYRENPIYAETGFSGPDDWYKGINEGHLLLFGDGMVHAGLWNKGAGASSEYGKKYAGMEQIVKPVLVNGYPELNLALAKKRLSPDKSADYALVPDAMLAGEHLAALGNTYPAAGTPGLNVQNLSDTLISLWQNKTGQTGNIEDCTESLQYLFDPEAKTSYRTVYEDVRGLFQLDDSGYYYYSMRDNFAEFSAAGGNHFILYDAPATTRTDANNQLVPGNFFPFNTGDEVFNALQEVDGQVGLGSTVASGGNAMNHHLGMTVETDFLQPRGGQVDTGAGRQDMTFEFSGDDDVWVFIDDVLVLDLGGIHSELYGIINFRDGSVKVGRAFLTDGIPDDLTQLDTPVINTTLHALFTAAGRDDGSVQWSNSNSSTFASGTSHTLKMFYLERGNYDSSLALRFNLQPLVYEQIRKVDQNGSPLPGVQFELYEASLANAGDAGAIECLYTDAGPSGNGQFYVKQTGTTPLVSMTTDADGYARFLTENGYFNFADGGSSYYILKEASTPSGYRSPPVDVVLHYDPTSAVLSVANRWTTGAYACAMIHVQGTGALYYGGTPSTDANHVLSTPRDLSPLGGEIPDTVLENGLPVAVPVLRKTSTGSWLALYGSNMGGFGSVAVGGSNADAWKNALLQAVLEQASGTGNGWYGSWDADNRRLTGVLNDMPGLSSRYLDGDDISIVYTILSPEALAALGISGDSPEARYEALRRYVRSHGVDDTLAALQSVTNGFSLMASGSFNRNFRSLIYLPNERRELRVWKVDQNGSGVSGASFGLYSDAACTRLAASGTTGTVDGQPGVLVFRAGGSGQGYANMVWDSRGVNEVFYLRENSAPAGHLRNTTVIPVRVGNYSIYADAGRRGDGVQVLAGAGTLTQTMRQYAQSNDVDITLRDITAFMQTQASDSFTLSGWQDAALSGSSALRSMNLHYALNTTRADGSYGLHNQDGGDIFKPFFSTDEGFIRARIQQNYAALNGQYDGSNNDANKDNLRQADLTNLFSLLNIVVITDPTVQSTNTGMLTIGKWVQTPSLADATALFQFKVELFGPDGSPLSGSFEYQFYGQDKVGRISSGDTLLLHHDERLTILGLPAGTRYTVTEADPAGGGSWNTLPASKTISGTIERDTAAPAVFINSRSSLSTGTGNLLIQKEVEAGGETDRDFTFTVTLHDDGGNELADIFTYTHTDGTTGTLASGDAIQLKHGESVTIAGLPIGTLYTVTEQAVPGYRSGVVGGSWVIGGVASGNNTTAKFINILYEEPPASAPGRSGGGDDGGDDGEDAPPPPAVTSAVPATGDDLDHWVLLAAASAAGLCAVGILRKRQTPPPRHARRKPRHAAGPKAGG